MRQSKSEIYLHFVWATYQRMPLVTTEREQAIYACICQITTRLECTVLAIGGMPNHVHLALQMPAKWSPSHLMQQIKGISSTFARDQLAFGEFFGWQDGYAVFSFSRSQRERVMEYVQNQKQHHAAGDLHGRWEETDEEVPRNPGVIIQGDERPV